MISPRSIDLNSLSSLSLEERKQLPKVSGVYFAIDSLGVVQYIGRSVNINKRWKKHHKLDQLEKQPGIKIAYLQIDEISLLPKIEEALINWFQPCLNSSQICTQGYKKTKKQIDNREFDKPKTKIIWKMAEVMARYKIGGKNLAKYLGVRGNAVSNLKNAETMPRLDGDKLNSLCNGLSKLSGVEISPNDLLEFTLDEILEDTEE